MTTPRKAAAAAKAAAEETKGKPAKKSADKDPRVLSASEITREESTRLRNRATEQGRANRPHDALRNGKRFAAINTVPWKLELAINMAWFVRSRDVSVDDWAYETLLSKVEAKGLSLPPGVDIQSAVQIVLADIEAADTAWFQANIEQPMDERFAAGLASHVAPIPRAVDAEPDSASWMFGRSYDTAEIQQVTLAVDLASASDELAAKAETLAAAAKRASSTKEVEHFEYQANVHAGAAMLARRIQTSPACPDNPRGLTEAIDAIYEESLLAGDERRSAATSVFLIDIATAIDPNLPVGAQGARFCTDIAETLRDLALGVTD